MKQPTTRKHGILARVRPLPARAAHEIQAFGSVVPMPIALAESTRRTSANNLNQYTAVGSATPTYDSNGNLTFDRSDVARIRSSVSASVV